ncbi:MAG: DUF3105 domain-containing protein [Pseudonocardiaceae bacterium]|nr:DUF3105 domain-containing protein [Pseudonocardiaceae bacterium]
MVSGKKKRGGGSKSATKAARAAVTASKPKPWGTIIAIVAVLLLAGGVFGYAYIQISENNKFRVSEDNQDPSESIAGVVRKEYPAGKHVTANERVAYDQSPPFGGPHDEVWADCEGIVYPKPVRSENMVHALEHGAVWIAYNPDQVKGQALNKLKQRTEGQQFTMLSPYPRLDKPISLQSWGHQLKVSSADDERIDQFIKSLRRNQYQYPEVDATCGPIPGRFDPNNPPTEPAAPPGPEAKPMNFGGDPQAQQDMGGGQQAPAGG